MRSEKITSWRPAAIDDVNLLAEFCIEYYTGAFESDPKQIAMYVPCMEAWLKKWVAVLFYSEDQPVVHAWYTENENEILLRQYSVKLKPNLQSKGYGTEAFQILKNDIWRSQHSKPIRLQVQNDKPTAVKFWKKLGFKITNSG